MSSSWLPAHYRRFNATTGRSAIFNCIDISPSWFSLIGFLLTSVEDFPCFVPEPETDSRHLYRSEEHTSELQSRQYLVCRLLLEKKNEHQVAHLLEAERHDSGDVRVVGDLF